MSFFFSQVISHVYSPFENTRITTTWHILMKSINYLPCFPADDIIWPFKSNWDDELCNKYQLIPPCCLTRYCFTYIHMSETPPAEVIMLDIRWIVNIVLISDPFTLPTWHQKQNRHPFLLLLGLLKHYHGILLLAADLAVLLHSPPISL